MGWLDTAILARADLGGGTVAGPAIIEEHDTTVVIPPGCSARLDEFANIDITVGS